MSRCTVRGKAMKSLFEAPHQMSGFGSSASRAMSDYVILHIFRQAVPCLRSTVARAKGAQCFIPEPTPRPERRRAFCLRRPMLASWLPRTVTVTCFPVEERATLRNLELPLSEISRPLSDGLSPDYDLVIRTPIARLRGQFWLENPITCAISSPNY